jgi:glucose-6-phosphate isomerase
MNTSSAWQRLEQHYQQVCKTGLVQLFERDPARAETCSLSAAGLTLDYSRNHVTADTVDLLLELARESKLPEAIRDLFNGEPVNNTENRPALHTSLRALTGAASSGGEHQVLAVLQRMEEMVAKINGSQWTGFSGEPITDVVNIGIGGSDLGPVMAVQALRSFHQKQVRCHFVSNIDPADISDTLSDCNPATTLFIVASKTFSTLETLQNANVARQWLLDAGADTSGLQHHLIAVSANPDRAMEFGVADENILPLWDWVGGRYSLWSAIGLPIAIAVGMPRFRELLAGAEAMDRHFLQADLPENMPVLLGLLAVWYNNFHGACAHAVLPYAQNLARFPAYLQQLCMESLGKSVRKDGKGVEQHTGQIIWGEPGTNGQHSFHQLLHQGTRLVPVDFILPLADSHGMAEQHRHLVACCLSQGRALMVGKGRQQVVNELIGEGMTIEQAEAMAPHMVVPGNRPSNTIVFDRLEPRMLGALVALYEHRVYVQSVIWGINAFDQWGVELGKQLGEEIFPALACEPGAGAEERDSSTDRLIELYRAAQKS